MKKYYFCFVFKQRLRRSGSGWNNLIKIRKIKNYRILDLSGPVKYFLFSKLLIFIVNLFHKKLHNFILISCDGLPLIRKNGINLWFGGSRLKIPNEFKNLKNNLVIVKNILHKKKDFITLNPSNLKNVIFDNDFKIIYASSIKANYSKKSKAVWNNYKNDLIKDFSLIDKNKFWSKNKLKKLDHKNDIYRDLKSLLRIFIIKKIHKKFKDRLIIVGDDWKEYIKDARSSNHEIEYIRKKYEGNICLDFGSRWGDNAMHPRSIEIIESGGFLLQSTQSDSVKTFGHLKIFNTFNSTQDLIKKINLFKQNFDLLNQNYKKIYNYYNNNELSYKTLTEIKKTSKK